MKLPLPSFLNSGRRSEDGHPTVVVSDLNSVSGTGTIHHHRQDEAATTKHCSDGVRVLVTQKLTMVCS